MWEMPGRCVNIIVVCWFALIVLLLAYLNLIWFKESPLRLTLLDEQDELPGKLSHKLTIANLLH